MALKRHIQHIGIALTQLLNTLLGGWPDESTSSRVYRLERQGRAYAGIARQWIARLFFWQHEHCRRAYEAERARYQLPPVLR